MQRFDASGLRGRRGAPRRERGIVMFMALILLLILTLLGVALARTQTVEERLAQNDNNHQLALQTAEAALQAAFDEDVDGVYTNFTGAAPGLATVFQELNTGAGTTLGYNSTWTTPGVNTILYNGSGNIPANGPPLLSAPAAANAQFVIENMAGVVPPGCSSANAGNYGTQVVYVHRITAHSAGGDGTASATVQTLHIGGC
jgi:type IV pilus assembly protein PilX